MSLFILTIGIFLGFFREFWTLLRDPKYRSLVFWFLIILLAGTLYYSQTEGWSLVDSLYFSVVTLATVGFGDFTPTTEAGRIFTVVYILFGLSILATFVNMLAKERQTLHDRRFEDRRNKGK